MLRLSVFDERLAHGLELQELALLAATIERLVRNEADSLLNVSFQAMGFYSPEKLSATDAMKIMEAYMASYILGTDSFGRELTAENVRLLLKNIGRDFESCLERLFKGATLAGRK